MRFWLVEITNLQDQRDDEVWQVRATSADAAKTIAISSGAMGRFAVARAVPARGGSKWERELAKELRTYLTRRFP